MGVNFQYNFLDCVGLAIIRLNTEIMSKCSEMNSYREMYPGEQEEGRYGWWRWEPKRLQFMNNALGFLVMFTLILITQGKILQCSDQPKLVIGQYRLSSLCDRPLHDLPTSNGAGYLCGDPVLDFTLICCVMLYISIIPI